MISADRSGPHPMPNRYVREGIIESEAVNSLNWQTEVFYRRLINRVDDFGRYTAHPALLLANLFPLQLDRISVRDIEQMLAECERVGLLFTYVIKGKRFLVMNKWEQGRAKTSEYPSPPENICQRMQTFVYTPKQMSTYAPDSDSDSDTDSAPVSGTPAGAQNADTPVELPVGFPRTAVEAKAHAAFLGCSEDFADKVWTKAVGRGGRDSKDIPIRNWRAHLATEWKYERERLQKQHGARQQGSRPGIDRSAGTANEGKAGDYSGLG